MRRDAGAPMGRSGGFTGSSSTNVPPPAAPHNTNPPARAPGTPDPREMRGIFSITPPAEHGAVDAAPGRPRAPAGLLAVAGRLHGARKTDTARSPERGCQEGRGLHGPRGASGRPDIYARGCARRGGRSQKKEDAAAPDAHDQSGIPTGNSRSLRVSAGLSGFCDLTGAPMALEATVVQCYVDVEDFQKARACRENSTPRGRRCLANTT